MTGPAGSKETSDDFDTFGTRYEIYTIRSFNEPSAVVWDGGFAVARKQEAVVGACNNKAAPCERKMLTFTSNCVYLHCIILQQTSDLGSHFPVEIQYELQHDDTKNPNTDEWERAIGKVLTGNGGIPFVPSWLIETFGTHLQNQAPVLWNVH